MKNEFVIDANIIFSSLLSGKDFYKNLFERNRFYTSDFALQELQTYQNTILSKTKLTKQELQEFTIFVFSHLIVVPQFYITLINKYKAYELCKDIDEKDTIYIALSLELNTTLLTRDKPLFNGLKNKGFEKIMMFDQFVEQLKQYSL